MRIGRRGEVLKKGREKEFLLEYTMEVKHFYSIVGNVSKQPTNVFSPCPFFLFAVPFPAWLVV